MVCAANVVAQNTFAPYCNSTETNSSIQHSEPRFAIKTNTLYWVALTPNIEAEVFLRDKLSVNADIQFAWWSSYDKRRYYQIFSASPELRYWFAEKRRFHGHYAGVYGGGGLYDLMLKPQGNGYQGEFWSAGVSYGYMMPLGKRLSLEMGIGVGILSTNYRRYVWDGDCYLKKAREKTVWFGPTKARVSLVWIIGRGGGR